MGVVGESLSEPHIAVISICAVLSVCLLPVLADCAKIDRMWASTTLHYTLPASAIPFRKSTFLDLF